MQKLDFQELTNNGAGIWRVDPKVHGLETIAAVHCDGAPMTEVATLLELTNNPEHWHQDKGVIHMTLPRYDEPVLHDIEIG